jgi:uncharacterized damage-inducible protein DinB
MKDPRYPIGPFVPPAAFTPDVRATCIGRLAVAARDLRQAVEGLSEEQLLHPYREDGWTVAQVVHHVADSHTNAYVRFKLAATADNPPVTAYSEGRWAVLADATGPNVGVSLDLLDALHSRWVDFLRSLGPEQFRRTFNHSDLGPVAIDYALALYAWHGRHHTAHVTTLRERMGW